MVQTLQGVRYIEMWKTPYINANLKSIKTCPKNWGKFTVHPYRKEYERWVESQTHLKTTKMILVVDEQLKDFEKVNESSFVGLNIWERQHIQEWI